MPETAYWDQPEAELLAALQASPQGLTSEEAARRLHEHGPNSLVRESRFAALLDVLKIFDNPLVLILLAAAVMSYFTGDHVDALIIFAIVLASLLLNFFQEFQARHAVERLRAQVAATAEVTRDGVAQERLTVELVPGDILTLNAGDLVPADARLLAATDLHVRESALTGESLPTEKRAGDLDRSAHTITDATNSVFLGTSVQTGIATAVVVRTGSATAFGAIASRLAQHPPETEFDRGIRTFGLMITRIILLLVLFVFLVNVTLHHGTRKPLESFLFAVALAVGLTPELLPMIISVTLAQGAKRMAKQKVIVKQLASIENFGSIEILCSDKTGTLTAGEIVLDKHLDMSGAESDRVLQLLYLNSAFEAGIKSPLDDAVLAHSHLSTDDYHKVAEIPFDFTRKRLSVVVDKDGARTLITKGASERVFDICTQVEVAGQAVPFDDARRAAAMETYKALSLDGYRVLGVAIRAMDGQTAFSTADETAMTLLGFAAFFDPPKPDVHATLETLRNDGITVVIMTGDNPYIAQKVAKDVGLDASAIVTADQIDAMDDAALAVQAEQGAIFAHVSPEQKNRVITALKARGRVVGFLGDGINDAPSLHAADVGISVMNGTDVAKEAANIILLEHDLSVLHAGVCEGRRSFANIMKYITMGTSSNFGNMFSMAAASLFLPFLPMLPTQILLNNLLYDASQLGIPSDNVDDELLHRPKRWNISFIRQFMLLIGPISSVYDFLTFAVLLWGFHAFHNDALFHTGWFVESLATQTLVVFVIRTAKNPFASRPNGKLLATVLTIVVVALLLPYTPLGGWLGFVPLPPLLLGAIIALTVTYLALVQVVKQWFYARHQLM